MEKENAERDAFTAEVQALEDAAECLRDILKGEGQSTYTHAVIEALDAQAFDGYDAHEIEAIEAVKEVLTELETDSDNIPYPLRQEVLGWIDALTLIIKGEK